MQARQKVKLLLNLGAGNRKKLRSAGSIIPGVPSSVAKAICKTILIFIFQYGSVKMIVSLQCTGKPVINFSLL